MTDRASQEKAEGLDNSSTRLFLHITKTAGGTLKSALSNTADLSTFFVYGHQDVEKLKESKPEKYDLIYGHSIFGIHSVIGLPNSARYMCFMRHPVTRTISHYFHLRNVDKGPIGDRIRTSTDINDFFENHSHWEFSNFMVKIISGVGNKRPDPGVNVFRLAVENLEKRFDFVGFQEYFPISIHNLSRVIGRKVVIGKEINVGHYSLHDVSSSTLRRIEELNAQDVRLYKFAIQKFL